MRQDRQSLTTDDLEAMFAFHASLLRDSDYFEYGMRKEPFPYEITPIVYHKFADHYWEEERKKGRMLANRGDGR